MPATADIRHTRRASRSKARRNPHIELKKLRINAGLSQEQLGLRANVSRETIRLVENFGWVPTPGIQFRIAAEFKLLPLDLWPIDQQRGVKGAR